ncbi:MAG: transporter substrate-binding domain-containing protein [Thermodesulfobacteriota bacterium]
MVRVVSRSLRIALTVWFLAMPSVSAARMDQDPESSHAPLTVACGRDMVPFQFVDENGQPAGMLIDIWRLWSQKTGISVIFKTGSWPETMEMVKGGRADIHAGLNYNEFNSRLYDLGLPLVKTASYYFYHQQIPGLESLDDLRGFRIGVVKGGHEASLIRGMALDDMLVEYESHKDLYAAVQRGEVRVFADLEVVAQHFLARQGIQARYLYHPHDPLEQNAFYPAIKIGRPDLRRVINAGLASLSEEELLAVRRRWIAQPEAPGRKVLVLSGYKEYPPFTSLNADNEPVGLFVDIWNLWAQKTGCRVKFIMTDWSNTLDLVKTNAVDAHSGLFRSSERQTYMDFSIPFYEIESAIFYAADLGKNLGVEALAGKKVGVQADTYQEQYLKENFPQLNRIVYLQMKEMINDGVGKKIDAFFDEVAHVQTYLMQTGKPDEFYIMKNPRFRRRVHAGVLKNSDNLLNEINMGLSAISQEELRKIEARWLISPDMRIFQEADDRQLLGNPEKAWLKDHQRIRLGIDPDWAPIEFLENGRHAGISADYVGFLRERLEVEMVPVAGDSWADTMEMLKRGEVDVFPCVSWTKKRQDDLSFTRPYLTFPLVLIAREEAPIIQGIQDLSGKILAVAENYAEHEWIQRDYPDQKLLLVKRPIDGLRAVAEGKADAYAGNHVMAAYYIRKEGLADLKLAAPTQYSYDIAVGVRKDWPELVWIIDKMLASISSREHSRIYNKWVAAGLETAIDWHLVWRVVFVLLLVAGSVFTVILFWNRRLSREIGERKKAQESLREVNAQQNLILENSMIGIIFSRGRRCEWTNPRLAKMMGYEIGELVGRSSRIMYKDDAQYQWLGEAAYPVLAAGKTFETTLDLKRKDGSLFWCRMVGRAVEPSKPMDGSIWLYDDISNLVKAEAEMQKAREEAEVANQAKSDFLARMSHEIRTPLNAVIGLTHLLRKTSLSVKQEDYLQKIQSSSHALLGVINDILDFSKIEAGRLTIENSVFNLNDILASISDMISVKAEEKGLEMVFAVSETVPQVLIGDALRLEQVLINLVNNAVKFTETGEIVLAIEMASREEDRVMLRFSVRDTGIGIAAEKIPTLFNDFSQADSSTTRRYGGSGLGLAICKRLVEMMNGSIAVDSRPGEGSKFQFTAEFGCPRTGEERYPALPDSIAGMRALVVDDNPVVQQVIRQMLANFGMTTTVLSSSAAALAELERAAGDSRERPYDLVIMDWKMPGMDGIQASGIIKEKLNLRPVPKIIMLTAFDRETVIQSAEKAGIDGFLTKPVTPSQLHDAIMMVFGKYILKAGKAPPLWENESHDLPTVPARILLVEDNEMNREVAQRLLEHGGFTVVVAENGREALRILESVAVEAVLMDLEMPEMDGYDCTRLIRETPERKELPIIAMTAHAIDSERDKCLKAGMDDFITKPFDPSHLYATLNRWIRGRKLSESAGDGGHPLAAALPEELPHIPGIHVPAGLLHCNGSAELLRKLLVKFYRHNMDTERKIREALDGGDTEQARRLAHSLKGVAGNIGAGEVFQHAGALEAGIRSGETPAIRSSLEALGKSLGAVLQAIAIAGMAVPRGEEASVAPSGQAEKFDMHELASIVARLFGYLRDDNVKAGPCAESMGPYLANAPAVMPVYRELRDHIGRYDYEKALNRLLVMTDLLDMPLGEAP